MKPKISVIIPVYNVELYLSDCLNSIMSQTLKAFELILVDDGSTDRSSEIMNFFAAKDSRIKLISQSNKGVSVARNTALLQASGDYILFVDSDDMIVYNALEVLYQQAIDNDADLVKGEMLAFLSDGALLPYYPRDKSLNGATPIPGYLAYRQLMSKGNFHPESCLFFVKRAIIMNNRLFYKENILHEDELWSVKTTFSANKVLLIDFNYYLYRQREGSIMHSDNILFRIRSLFEVAKELNEYTQELEKKQVPNDAITCVYEKIFWLCNFIYSLLYQNKTIHFSCPDYFAGILTTIYPILSYRQQRYCLDQFCVSQVLFSTR
ncbi:MAG: glycosyltransferase [Candidatus Symbiothrix sp.]|nr:glycosyltransferase [Candidatus Symbiothrix sp.]